MVHSMERHGADGCSVAAQPPPSPPKCEAAVVGMAQWARAQGGVAAWPSAWADRQSPHWATVQLALPGPFPPQPTPSGPGLWESGSRPPVDRPEPYTTQSHLRASAEFKTVAASTGERGPAEIGEGGASIASQLLQQHPGLWMGAQRSLLLMITPTSPPGHSAFRACAGPHIPMATVAGPSTQYCLALAGPIRSPQDLASNESPGSSRPLHTDWAARGAALSFELVDPAVFAGLSQGAMALLGGKLEGLGSSLRGSESRMTGPFPPWTVTLKGDERSSRLHFSSSNWAAIIREGSLTRPPLLSFFCTSLPFPTFFNFRLLSQSPLSAR
eukprot:superscaffoldBa00003571_g17246